MFGQLIAAKVLLEREGKQIRGALPIVLFVVGDELSAGVHNLFGGHESRRAGDILVRAGLIGTEEQVEDFQALHNPLGVAPAHGQIEVRQRLALTACPGSLSRITELSQHASVEPGDCVLNYPAFWEDHEPFGLIRTFNTFCLESEGRSSQDQS